MCVEGLLGSLTTIHVASGKVKPPLNNPMYLDCQSLMGFRVNVAIFGHMLEGSRKGTSISVTVPVLLSQEPVHHPLFVRTSIATQALATHLQKILSSGSPTIRSGMERIATLVAGAATMLLLHGSGEHSRRPQTTSKCAGVSYSTCCVIEWASSFWNFMFTNSSLLYSTLDELMAI